MTGGTIDAQGQNVAVEMRDNSTLDGVEIFNTSSSYGGGIYVQGNGVNIHDCYIHNTGNDGINVNTDGAANGIKNLTITNCLITDTGWDGIHVKGTNYFQGQARDQAQAMENIRVTFTRSLRASPATAFGFEFQDGQLNCYYANNDSDRTYSIVGGTGFQVLNNTAEVATSTNNAWGYESGNMINSTWDNNTSTGATSAGIALTGGNTTSNMNTTYSNNKIYGPTPEGFQLSNGSYNTFTNSGFHDVGEWFHNNGNYDQSHDVTTGSYAY